MKSDFGIRWIQLGQWITFQSGGEKFGPHMDVTVLGQILSLPGSTGVGGLKFQGSQLHTFSSSSWMEYFEGYIATLGKCSCD